MAVTIWVRPQKGTTPSTAATTDHLVDRADSTAQAEYDNPVNRVLACYRCNERRNHEATRRRAVEHSRLAKQGRAVKARFAMTKAAEVIEVQATLVESPRAVEPVHNRWQRTPRPFGYRFVIKG